MISLDGRLPRRLRDAAPVDHKIEQPWPTHLLRASPATSR
jgi:hypothetical protein